MAWFVPNGDHSLASECRGRPNTMAEIGLGCLWARREGLHTAASAEGV